MLEQVSDKERMEAAGLTWYGFWDGCLLVNPEELWRLLPNPDLAPEETPATMVKCAWCKGQGFNGDRRDLPDGVTICSRCKGRGSHLANEEAEQTKATMSCKNAILTAVVTRCRIEIGVGSSTITIEDIDKWDAETLRDALLRQFPLPEDKEAN